MMPAFNSENIKVVRAKAASPNGAGSDKAGSLGTATSLASLVSATFLLSPISPSTQPTALTQPPNNLLSKPPIISLIPNRGILYSAQPL
jgi:hypothetical protein